MNLSDTFHRITTKFMPRIPSIVSLQSSCLGYLPSYHYKTHALLQFFRANSFYSDQRVSSFCCILGCLLILKGYIPYPSTLHLYGIPLPIIVLIQYWPGSRAERPIPSSAPRGGGEEDPPLGIGKQEVGTYIYSLLYTHTGLLGRLLLKFYSR